MVVTVKVRGMYDVQISDADMVNPEAFIPRGEYNPHRVRPWLALDHGFPVGIVFADCEQDALDELADSGRLDRYQVAPEELGEYGEEEEGITRLGGASEPFDIQTMMLEELPTPPFSFCAMLADAQYAQTA